jgi:lactoylglutathione lyase
MQLGCAILYVPDIASSLIFFERAFGFKRRFLHEFAHAHALREGASELSAPVTKPWGQVVLCF